MQGLKIEGIPQKDLDRCIEKIEQFQKWAAQEKLDRWAFRAALLTALYEDSEEYFEKTNSTYREMAAFDNGVATTLDSLKGK
ncbi:MAG: hypothetical protein ACYCPW_12610 [Nitrososphaerales archaeon]